MLTEYKNDTSHYFRDAKGRLQGEYKEWHENGQLRVHCFCVDDEVHGECKWWDKDGTLISHNFYEHSELYRDLLVNPVTEYDKFLITLETGSKWLDINSKRCIVNNHQVRDKFMSLQMDKLYSDLGDVHYKLCMEHNKCASYLMSQDCSGEKRDIMLDAKRKSISEATTKINEALALIRNL
jgi:hypothetical protein